VSDSAFEFMTRERNEVNYSNRKPTLERILVVDDDDSVRNSLMEVLVLEGFSVPGAANGEEALAILEKEHIDLVMLDLNMPRLNGWDTFERLVERWPLLPIIIVTARPNQLFLAANCGAGALLEKPIDIPVMLSAIRTLLDESTSSRLARLAGRTDEFIYAEGNRHLSKRR
jgi:two-component system OmpR family response regulator